jgi:PhnB protein
LKYIINNRPDMSTSYKPEGYHSIQPYLVVADAAKAVAFYSELFGAEVVMSMPSADGSRLLHVELRIGDCLLMLSDEFPDWGAFGPSKYGGTPVSLMHYVPDVDAVFAKATTMGCKTVFPPTDQFWGDRHCKFTDPFGHVWGVATHKFDPTPEQLAAGAKAFGS